MLSILIPVYNVRMYIERCIKSLLAQSDLDIEIILLDDGSTDGSGEICDYYNSLYPNLISAYHQTNSGLLMTRRRLFAMAKGDYLLCVDSDDYVSPYLVTKIKDTFQRTACDIVLFDFMIMKRTPLRKKKFVEYNAFSEDRIFKDNSMAELYEELFKGNQINAIWRKCFRRELLDIDTDYSEFAFLKMGEDLLQSIPLITRAKSVAYIKSPLYYYTVIGKSMSRSFQKEKYESYKVVMQRMDEVLPTLDFVKGLNILNETKRNFILSALTEVAKLDCKYNFKERFEYYEMIRADEFFQTFYSTNKRLPKPLTWLYNKSYLPLEIFIVYIRFINLMKYPLRSYVYVG